MSDVHAGMNKETGLLTWSCLLGVHVARTGTSIGRGID